MLMRVLASLVLLSVCQLAYSQQEVSFPAAPGTRSAYAGKVDAIFSLPQSTVPKVPAVVLIHTRGGYEPSRTDLYGAALRQAGIATLDLILFRYVARNEVPSDFIAHAFGALKYLAAHSRIDPTKIGIAGVSLGGILSIYTASEQLASEHLGSGLRFAAHAPIYPVCWLHEQMARGERRRKLGNPYTKLTGTPIRILAGGKDRYDDPDSCQKFIQALPPESQKHVALTYFPEATHGWDGGTTRRYMDARACKGRGCEIEEIADPEIAVKGRQVVVEFFSSHLLQAESKR